MTSARFHLRPRGARFVCSAAALLLAAGGLAACGGDAGDSGDDGAATAARGEPVPLVVDTDLAADDLIALLFLLGSPDAEVRAITVSGTGEVRCPQGLEVAARLLAVTGDEDIPVACGRATPLDGDAAFPDEWRDATDAAYGLPLPEAEVTGDPDGAVELLIEQLSGGGVTLLTLGPLTNVAEAFRDAPDLAAELAALVVMGGAVDTAGNVPSQGAGPPTVEWNLHVDPTAAAEVLSSGAPVVLIPLDVTNQAPVTLDFVARLEDDADTEPAELVAELLGGNPMVEAGDYYFWDPLAAAVALGADLVQTEPDTLTVVTEDGPDRGRTVRRAEVDGGHAVAVAVEVDVAAFEDLLVSTLAR
jgi:pyrimidine-specific ribonucleoside hydrolase